MASNYRNRGAFSAFDVSVVGDVKLSNKLRSLTPKIQGKVVRPALREAVKIALPAIRAATPVRTGKLRKGLRVRSTKRGRGRGRGAAVGIHTPPRDKLGIDPGDPYYYPAGVELGNEHSAGTAFMRGPFKSLRDRMLRKMRVALWRGIRKQAEAGGRK